MGARVSRLDSASVDQLYRTLLNRLAGLCKAGQLDLVDEQSLRCILRYFQGRHQFRIEGDVKTLGRAELCANVRRLIRSRPGSPEPLEVEFRTGTVLNE